METKTLLFEEMNGKYQKTRKKMKEKNSDIFVAIKSLNDIHLYSFYF